MTNVVCQEDCGNAPRKKLLKNLNIAFAKGDVQAIVELADDDIVWHMVGDKVVRGKRHFADALEQMKGSQAKELVISNIITHGKSAAVNGTLTFDDNTYAFCDVYVFNSTSKNAKIKEMTSYALEV